MGTGPARERRVQPRRHPRRHRLLTTRRRESGTPPPASRSPSSSTGTWSGAPRSAPTAPASSPPPATTRRHGMLPPAMPGDNVGWDAATGKPLASPRWAPGTGCQERRVQPRRRPRRHRLDDDDRASLGRRHRQGPRRPPEHCEDAVTERRVQPRRHPRRHRLRPDKTARVWDAATGKALASCDGHRERCRRAPRSAPTAPASSPPPWTRPRGSGTPPPASRSPSSRCTGTGSWSAAFSPDGTRVVTPQWDKTARVWDAATGKALAVLEAQDAGPRAPRSARRPRRHRR